MDIVYNPGFGPDTGEAFASGEMKTEGLLGNAWPLQYMVRVCPGTPVRMGAAPGFDPCFPNALDSEECTPESLQGWLHSE